MATIQTTQSASIDFVNCAIPNTVTIFTVPANNDYVLLSATVITTAITGSGSPTVTVGNSGNASAYQLELQTTAFDFLNSLPTLPQTTVIPAGTAITATVTVNSTATAHTGTVAISGYLVSTSGVDTTPLAPVVSDLIGFFYTLDPGGNALPAVNVSYALALPPVGITAAWDSSPQTVTSDGTGLVQIPIEAGATYQLWSGCQSPIVVTVPLTATSPFQLPDIRFVV
jgi:hypothetical protein